MQEGKREEALEEYEEGIKRFYHSEKLHQNLGLLLEELANEDFLQGRSASTEGALEVDAIANRLWCDPVPAEQMTNASLADFLERAGSTWNATI